MRKKWTSSEMNLIRILRKKNVQYKDIAKKIGGVSTNAVGMRIRKLARKGEIKTKKWIHDDNYTFDNIKKEELMKGILIWWCEGTKPSKGNNSVEFVNSDPILVWHFLNFLRKLDINEKKIKLRLKINLEEEMKAKKSWCKILNLPVSSFNKSTSPSGKGKRKKRLKYGTLTIKYSSKKLLCDLVRIWKDIMEKDIPNNLEEDKYQINWI